MSAEENKALVHREMEELFNHTGNLDAVEEIVSPNYVSYEPTSGEVRGIEGARQFAANYRQAFPDLENIVEDMVAEGDKVVVRFKARGTHEGETGKPSVHPRASAWI
jgi:predicted ester cyclase